MEINGEITMSQFQPGEIHNPLGRPKGSGHRQQLFNELVMPHKTALLNKAIELALNGNEAMLRLFLERMLPAKPRDEPISLELPCDLTKADALLSMGEIILRGIVSQDITPNQGKIILNLSEEQRRLTKIKEYDTELANIIGGSLNTLHL
jgi:hypothetical protein